MNTSKKMWKWILVVVALSIAVTISFLPSCEKEQIMPSEPSQINVPVDNADEEKSLDMNNICGKRVQRSLLYYNQNKIGDVFMYNDREFLYVKIYAAQGFLLRNVYMYLGSYTDLPFDDYGHLDYLNFNYKIVLNNTSTIRRFRIPLSELSKQFTVSLMVQTKSSLAQKPTYIRFKPAWAEGKAVGADGFGRVFNHVLGDCGADPDVVYLQ
jgi:hypothetical protein